MKLFNQRENCNKNSLNIDEIGNNPMDFFIKWFKEAEKNHKIIEANAMTISTVDNKNIPLSRVVLLKEIKENSLIFFTNYKSRKGEAISDNPNICASFYWPPLERQVIFKGIAKKCSQNYSEEYFKSRPFNSQAAAIVSNQSQIIPSYQELLNRYNKFLKENKNSTLKKPNNWGGVEVNIKEIEFWQGRENRLHNRVVCVFMNHKWEIKLLSP